MSLQFFKIAPEQLRNLIWNVTASPTEAIGFQSRAIPLLNRFDDYLSLIALPRADRDQNKSIAWRQILLDIPMLARFRPTGRELQSLLRDHATSAIALAQGLEKCISLMRTPKDFIDLMSGDGRRFWTKVKTSDQQIELARVHISDFFKLNPNANDVLEFQKKLFGNGISAFSNPLLSTHFGAFLNTRPSEKDIELLLKSASVDDNLKIRLTKIYKSQVRTQTLTTIRMTCESLFESHL